MGHIINFLGFKNFYVRWVTRKLTDKMKADSFEGNSGSFVKRRLRILWWTVIGDKNWAHHYDPENKRRSMEYHHKESPAPKKFKTKALAGSHVDRMLEL